ncbi:MAG TPA: prolyl oligopeptidase family serine peptidase [Blastocatellia bacterium]|jgi:dipeptidyl aminopeptidase/acylaminoacyl peptidase|nr:prolyl oligopeptidase family serine peptidase [Blastocatellia bacterium]
MRSLRLRAFFSLSLFLGSLVAAHGAVSPAPGSQAGANGGASGSSNGSIVEIKPYPFPPYDQAEKNTDVENYASRAEYEKAVSDPRFEFQKVKYLSDGLKVIAYLYKPRTTEGLKLPTIIFNRGSVVRSDIAPELVTCFHRLASEGFAILAPMYRQSDGGEGRDEVGGADVNDLMNVLPLARSLQFVDDRNLFMYGESRGGIMTLQAIRNHFPINAAAVFGTITDVEAYIKQHSSDPPQYRIVPERIWPDYEKKKEEIIRLRSAIYWPEQLDVPLFIMHGGADPAVAPDHSLSLAQKLQKLGKTYELLIYAGDNHILSNNRLDRDKRAIAWFKKFMKP